MAEFIRYTVEDKVAVLVIDHPPVNAINEQSLKELSEAIDALNADPGVKVIVITGGGQLAFVAGADIGTFGEIIKGQDFDRAKALIESGHNTFSKIENFLDGGFVGRTSSDGPGLFRAVRAGEREVIVRDASGREARTVAQVEKGRRTSISLALMKGDSASANGLRPLGRNPQGGKEFWREKDGAIVVRIPGGEFQMGSPEAEGDPSEHPRHAVRVKGFLMDKTEVTGGQYRRFLTASSQPPPKSPIWGMPEALPASSIGRGPRLLFLGRGPTPDRGGMGARRPGRRRAAVSLGQRVRPLAVQYERRWTSGRRAFCAR